MTCPVCHQGMETQDFDGVAVDVCPRCKGMWYDWSELASLEKPTGQLTPALQAALDSPRQPDENRGAIACPKCSVPLHRHIFRMVKGVVIDECYQCGGFFLDAGELKAIRETNMTAAEHTTYCERVINTVPEVQQSNMGAAQLMMRTRAMRRWNSLLGNWSLW